MDTECLNIFKKHIAFWKRYPPPSVYFSDTPYVIKNSEQSNIELWVSLYNSSRNHEMLSALDFNLKNQAISKINIILEDSDLKLSQDIAFDPRVSIIPIKKAWRTKYSDIIKLIPTSSKSINIILNSDIVLSYFDQKILQGLADDELVVLTRHEITNDCVTMDDFVKKGVPLSNCSSSDVWIFKGHPQIEGDIYLGIPGCEHMFIMDFVQKNYKVYNFGDLIPAYHLHKNNDKPSYRFTYFLSKNFKITFIKKQSQLFENQSEDTQILDSVEPLELSIKKAVASLTTIFNEELQQYTTLIDVYNESLNFETESIQSKLIDSAKTNMEQELNIFYNKELAARTEALNKKLEIEELEFTKRLKEQLEEKFNSMYENEFFMKKKSLSERLEREEEDFKKKLVASQTAIIEEYKESKFKEINSAIFLHNERMTKKINEELIFTKEAMIAKLLQEMTIKKEEYACELNSLIAESDRVFKDKKLELQKNYAAEVASCNEEKALVKTRIAELREEEQALREKNDLFLSKIDESCEEYKKAKINQIEDSLEDIKQKLSKEEEHLQTTISANNQLLDDSIGEIKSKLLSEEEYMHSTILANAEIIEEELRDKKKLVEIEYSNFLERVKSKIEEVNKEQARKLAESELEIVRKRNVSLDELNSEIHREKEKAIIALKTELETEKKEVNDQLLLFTEEIITQKKLILTELSEFKEAEYHKARLLIDEYAEKYRSKINSELEKYSEMEHLAKDSALKEYENKRISEIHSDLTSKQKIQDQTLSEYIETIQTRMKEEYTRLKFDQEVAIREWNASYSSEQLKLNVLRNEKSEALSLFARQTNANIEESTQKISENIKIFNYEYSTKLAKMKEKLSDVRNTILYEHEQLRLSESKRLESLFKENNAILAKERTERESEITQLFSIEKSKIENEIEALRADGTLKVITELNEKRELLTSELDDELRSYRETQIDDIRRDIERSVMAKLEKTIAIRDAEDRKSREDEQKEFNEFMNNLRETELGIIQKTKESTILRLDTRITELRKQLFELERNVRDAEK